MKQKILFINPPISLPKAVRYANFKFPMGFLYMAGVLLKNNHQVKILDCQLDYEKRILVDNETMRIGSSDEDILKEINSFKPDIIGVSCAFTHYESDSFRIIELIKNNYKPKFKPLIVVGGAHASANTAFVLRNKNIDLAVIGEGEITMLEIADKFNHKTIPKKIKGTALNIKAKIKFNPGREPVKELDNLFPAYELLDIEKYFSHPDNSMATMRKRVVDIITSRGCPANCVFCSIHSVWGRKWRGRSVKSVVDEIEFLVKNYNVFQLRIQDDNFTWDKKRAIDICNEILNRKLDIKWDTPNGVAIWALDEEVLSKMKQAGCYRVTLGIESGCKKSQAYVRKVLDFKKIQSIIDSCNKLKIWVAATFIIGFPYETKEEILETSNYIRTLKINFPFIYIAQPYPGTDMYNDFKKENLLDEIMEKSNYDLTKYNTLNLSNDELNLLSRKLFFKFYVQKMLSCTNPINLYKEFLSKTRTMEDFVYAVKMFKAVIFG